MKCFVCKKSLIRGLKAVKIGICSKRGMYLKYGMWLNVIEIGEECNEDFASWLTWSLYGSLECAFTLVRISEIFLSSIILKMID